MPFVKDTKLKITVRDEKVLDVMVEVTVELTDAEKRFSGNCIKLINTTHMIGATIRSMDNDVMAPYDLLSCGLARLDLEPGETGKVFAFNKVLPRYDELNEDVDFILMQEDELVAVGRVYAGVQSFLTLSEMVSDVQTGFF